MQLRVQQDVRVRAGARPDGPEGGARVMHIGRGGVRLAILTAGQNLFRLAPGDPVEWDVTAGASLLLWQSRVTGWEAGEPPVLVVAPPGPPQRLQRRQHVRMIASLTATYQVLGVQVACRLAGRTRDIGAGGLCLVTASQVRANDSLFMEIDLPGIGTIEALGEVVRVRCEVLDLGGVRYVSAVRFTDISERHADAVVRYVFAEQLEWRRRGLM